MVREDFYTPAWAVVIAKREGADYVWSWDPGENPHSIWNSDKP